MDWSLAIVAAPLAVAGVSWRIAGTSMTSAMLFVAIGLLVGPRAIDALSPELGRDGPTPGRGHAGGGALLRRFADQAARAAPSRAVPVRLLGFGLP